MNNLNDIFFAPVANQDLTYDQVLEDVQRYFAENHASTIAEAGEGNAERATTLLKELMVQYIVKRKYAIEGLTTEELCEKLYEDMGTLANGDLRHKRILAHRALEQLRQSRHMEKWEVYIWLQAKLGLDERQTHIGQFSEWMCDEVVRLCRQASAPPAAGQAAA